MKTWHGAVEDAIDRTLAHSPFQTVFQWHAARRLVVLAYHGIDDGDQFGRQIQRLVTVMHPVSLDEVLDAMHAGRRLPKGAVLLTFDDGDRSILELGLPILREHCVPAVAFVVAGLVDTQKPFWWDEVVQLLRRGATVPCLASEDPIASVRYLKQVPDEHRREVIDRLRRSIPEHADAADQLSTSELRILDAGGVAIGNHTLTHPCLDRCTPGTLRVEIERPHEILTGALGRAPRVFAYPNGNVHAEASALLKNLGYEAAFLFDHQISAFPPADPYRISRVRVNATTSLDRWQIVASGLHPSVHRLIGRQ